MRIWVAALVAGLLSVAAPVAAQTEPDPFDAPLPGLEEDGEGDPSESLARAKVLRELGQLEDAAREYREALDLDPGNVEALEGLRRTLIAAQRTERLPDVLAQLVDRYHRAGRAGPHAQAHRDLAGRRFDELVTLDPEHAERDALAQRLGRDRGPRASDGANLGGRARSALGLLVLLGIAFALSSNWRKVSLRVVGWGIGLQVVFALLILKTPPGRWLFGWARDVVNKILSFTDHGARFIFGNLYDGLGPIGPRGPVMYVDGTTGELESLGLVFAFHILPTIIFFGSLMAILYHLGIVQKIVRGIAWLMTKTMRTSGAESLSAAGNIFVGQTEAPLLIKPYVSKMTRSELMAVMTGGFATVAGGVLAAYVRFGLDAGHLLAASVMSAPAALVVAKIMYPEVDTPETAGGAVHDPEKQTANVIDAAATGAADGLKLAANVAAMLLAFISLIALLNWMLSPLGVGLKEIFGYAFYPLSWVMGVDTQDLMAFGTLLGTKISINEFVAFVELGSLKHTMTERSFTIATYALCGFANFSSIGIQIGGISSVAPERRADLARIGLKAMAGGAIASWLTACIAGVLL